MQLVYAGPRPLIQLELESALIRHGAAECGFTCGIDDRERQTFLDLEAEESEGPLLLFDAADPANAGLFARCQFYVDARTGAVLQTPFLVANRLDGRKRVATRALRLQINKELPSTFRLPGRQPVSEKILYSVLFNFLTALRQTGVGLCGTGIVKPLTGR